MPTGINSKTKYSLKFEDLTGLRFKKLIVLKLFKILRGINKRGRKTSRAKWLVRCECGNEIIMETWNVKNIGNCRGTAHKKEGKERKNFNDLTGRRFGKLVVIEYMGSIKSGNGKHNKWKCKCDCGNETIVNAARLTSKKKKNRTFSCGCLAREVGVKNQNWKGYKLFPGTYWSALIYRCKKINRELTITPEDVEKKYEEQNGLCALSKLPISFGDLTLAFKDREITASLDRIDSSKGYTKDNIQLVHRNINLMKNVYSQEHFIEMCKLVTNKNIYEEKEKETII